MFLSKESNAELKEVIARGDLMAIQNTLSEKRAVARDTNRWLELSADLVKVFVQQSRYAEAERIVDEIEAKLGRPSMRKPRIAVLSLTLCLAQLILPQSALPGFTKFLSGVSGFSGSSTYVLDSVLWGIFWQDLWRAQTYTVLMCFASQDDKERSRAFAMLAYCLLIRGWESLGNWSLLRVLSQTSRTFSKEYTDTFFWVGISNRWRSRAAECLNCHANFESRFPGADGFYRIISDSSRLQLALAELGPSDVDFYYRKCHSETISMKHGRHQIHLKGARACLAGINGGTQALSSHLREAKEISEKVANTLDSLLFTWMSTIAYLNAGMSKEAQESFREFQYFVKRYGNPKLFRQEVLRLSHILKYTPMTSVLWSSFTYLVGCLSFRSFHRFLRGVKHAGAWIRDGEVSYWSKSARLDYLVSNQNEQESHEPFMNLFSAISEEFSSLATRNTDQSVNLDEVVTLIERTLLTKDIFIENTLDELIDRTQKQDILINVLARNEGSHSVRVPSKDGRIFIGVEEIHRSGKESLAIGVLVQRTSFREESTDLIEFSLSILMKYFFLMRDIRSAYQKEEESQRNHAIADTARMLAHDIRRPFSMLKAMIHTMGKISSLQEMNGFFERNLPELNRGIQSIEDMVADIIEFGKPVIFRGAPISLDEIIDRSLANTFALEPDTKVRLEYSFTLSRKLQGEYNQCLRLVSNIIGNAATALRATNSPRIWFRARERDDHRTEIVIGNNGPAISAKDLPEIFLPFFTRGNKEGTGLGLAIAKKVVEAHGGTLECHSGEGSTEFVFSIPTSSELAAKSIPLPTSARTYHRGLSTLGATGGELPEEQAETPLNEECSLRLKNYSRPLTLLIVDDEVSYRDAIKSLVGSNPLLRDHVRVFEAATFSEAVTFDKAPTLDVLVCDIDLRDSGGDGLEVVKRLRQRFPEAEICIHSNRYLPGDSKRALEAGADSFFPKPMNSGHLIKLTNSWLGKNLGRPKVAIVDDDSLIQECWRMELQAEYQVIGYDSPAAFLENGRSLGELACVITDYQFKGVRGEVSNGVQLAYKIKEKDGALPVILSSGFDVEDKSIFSAIFAKGSIPKPKELRKFLRAPLGRP